MPFVLMKESRACHGNLGITDRRVRVRSRIRVVLINRRANVCRENCKILQHHIKKKISVSCKYLHELHKLLKTH